MVCASKVANKTLTTKQRAQVVGRGTQVPLSGKKLEWYNIGEHAENGEELTLIWSFIPSFLLSIFKITKRVLLSNSVFCL